MPYFKSAVLAILATFTLLPLKAQKDSLLTIPYVQYVSDYDLYAPAFEKAIARARTKNDSVALAKLLVRHCVVTYLNGEQDNSANSIIEAIAIYKILQDTSGSSAAMAMLGYQLKRRDLDKAEHYIREALSLQFLTKDSTELLVTLDHYGVIKEMRGNLDSAAYYYQESLRLKRILGDTNGIPFSINNLAGIAYMQENFPEAIQYLDTSDILRKTQNNEFYLAQNATLKGQIYKAWSKPDSAISYYKKAINLAKKGGQDYLVREAAKDLSEIYASSNNYEEALSYRLLYETSKDNIVNENTNQNINKLLVQYETAEKEKKIAEQNELLTKETLKARNRQILLSVSGLLLILAITIGWYQIRIARQKKEKAEKEGRLQLQNERVRVSRDLHDHIGSELTLIVSSANTQSRKIEDTSIQEKVKNIGENAKNAMSQLRETIWAINPEGITLQAFSDRLRSHALRMCQASNMELNFTDSLPNGNTQLGPSVTINIFRVCQEAINNACKYAEASKLEISVAEMSGAISVAIKDNGKGFDENAIAKGYGLDNMRSRIQEIGGTTSIQSAQNQGCKILINNPLQSKEASSI